MNPIIPRVYLNLQRTASARRILLPVFKRRIVKRGFILLCALGGLGAQGLANAAVSCSANATTLDFGAIDILSGAGSASTNTITWTCTNDSRASTAYVTFCLNIGDGTGGVSGSTRQMANGSNKMNFQLYQDNARSSVWGSELGGGVANGTPFQDKFTIPSRTSITRTVTVFGSVLGGQTTLIPGNYLSQFTAVNSAVSGQFRTGGSNYPNTCGGQDSGIYFPFNVKATVVKNCTVTAGATLELGSWPASQTNISASNAINVTCTNTTPFTVGLAPSNGSSTGAGVMSGSASGNTDQLPYQLYSNSALSTPWGNTATATSVGNGVAGTGTGTSKQLTVWAKVNSADVTPDAYEDTVTINVNY